MSVEAVSIPGSQRLEVRLPHDGHVFCWHQDPDGAVSQIFPNPYQTDTALAGGATYLVPDAIAAEHVAITGDGLHFLCVAFAFDPSKTLPTPLRARPFQDLRSDEIGSLDDIQTIVESVYGSGVYVVAANGQ